MEEVFKPFLLIIFFLVFANSASFAQEAGNCGDGVDNDGDGLIDCYDSDCSGSVDCDGFYFGGTASGCQSTPAPGTPFTLTKIWDTDASMYPMDSRQTALVGDIDGDGDTEVVGIDDNAGKIYAFSGVDGSLVMEITTPRQDVQTNATAFADVDNDGFSEFFIVIQNGGSPRLERYDPDGAATLSTATWTSTSEVGHGGSNDDRYTPEIADFNEDGVPEIYLGDQIFNSVTGARIISGSGSRGEHTSGEPFSVAADVLPDAACANCAGLELVAGNEVYSVDIGTGTFTLEVSAPATLNDGVTSIVDWDLDGDLDAIVNEGRYVYAWDIQTSTQLGSTFDIRSATISNSTGSGGHANVADFDSDGRPEIGLAGLNVYVVIDDFSSGMGELWSKATVDASQRTGSTVYDFHADGFFEVIYRDEQTLYVYNGTDGSVMASITCGAGTRMEYPVVADANDDGQSEIVCPCQDAPAPSNSGSNYISMFRSNDYPWVSARKVWNQHNYFEVSILDDLTVPVELQDHSLVPGSNNFLAQSTYRLSNGSANLSAPDATVTITTAVDKTNCGPAPYQIDVTVDVTNSGDWPLAASTPVSFYNGDPYAGGATFMHVGELGSQLEAGNMTSVTYTLPEQHEDFDLYVLVNHNGLALPPAAPDYVASHVGECDYSNNLFGPLSITDCQSPPIGVDAMVILDENSANGTSVHTVGASDPDVGATWTFSITGGNTGSTFDIDTNTGEITVNDNTLLDFSISVFTLTVTIEDNDGLTDDATITINIDDEAVYSVNAAKNEDNYSNGDQLASVTDGNGAITNAVLASGTLPGWMSLNATTGEITVNDATLVADGTYTVDITTTDADGGVTTQTVSIVIDPDTEAVYTVNAAQNEDSYSNGDQLASVSDADGAIASAVLASGTLPGWISLNATSGEITVNDATLVADGSYTVDITTTDATGGVTTQTVSIVIDPDTEAVYTVNAAQNEDSYSNGDQLASVTDADGAITSAVTASGSLPGWMSLNATSGEITVNDATLVADGTYTVDITTTDATGGVTTQTVSIVIDPDTESVYTVNAAQNEDSYSNGDQLASVSDADGAIASAVLASGTLPGWISLNATSGEITVNDATLVADGSYTVDITTTDATGGVTTQTVSIVIDPDTEAVYIVNAAQNEDSYSDGDQLASVSDADGAITSAVLASGTLPGWMSLNATTGEITVNDATLVADGTYTVDITTTDATGGVTTQTVSIVIDPDTEAVYTVNAAQNEDSYSNGDQLASVSDVDGAITSAVLASGTLPGWMSLNATSGEITVNDATLVADGTYTVDITTTDATGGLTTQTVSIVIDPDTEAVYTVNAAQNEDSYSNGDQLASVSDADGAITSAVIASGTLPGWMSLNATTGEITVNDATLVADGTYTVDITTTDTTGGVTTQTVSIVIDPDTEAVYTVNAAQNEDSYSNGDQLASVSDADGTITSAVLASGTLPGWISLNATTGEITVNDATLVADGTYTVDITTTDATGGVTTQTVSIVIDPDTEAVYTVNAAQNEDSYSNGDQLASVSDADGAITGAVIASGTLPGWMSLNATTGEITVNDATLVADGTYTVDITTTDATGGVTTQTVSIVIDPDTEAVYTVNAAQNEDSYSNGDQLASVTDVDGSITSAVLSSGTLPPWMSLNAITGEITVNDATLVADGTYTVDITTTDVAGGSTTQTVSIVIDPDTEAVYSVNPAQNEDSYNNGDQLASVTDVDGSITSAVLASGTLPPWMSLNAITGEVTVNDATLVADGTYNVDITTTDATGGETTQTVSIVIDPDTEAVYTTNPAQNEDSYSNGDQLASVTDVDGSITSAVLASGTLPPWMSLNATTGEITVNDATQVADGTHTVDITTTDVNGGTTTQTVSIVIDPDTEAVYTLNPAQNEDSYSNGDQLASVTDTDGVITSAVLASGTLPPWMSLNTTTGEITVNDATQVADGTYTVDITTTDVNGGTTTQTVSIVIDPDTEAVYSVNPAQNEDSYSNGDQLASVSDADGAITSAALASGTLPPWMSLNTTTGEITVNDATQLAPGTYTVDITVTDAAGGITTLPVTIVINEDIEATNTVAPPTNVNNYNNEDVLVTIGDDNGPLVSTTITQGSLPPGVAMDPVTGEITVSDASVLPEGTFTIEIETVDNEGGTTIQPIEFTILPYDTDGDGIPDTVEVGPDSGNPVDTDMDGVPDFEDPDSDNDGIPDEEESGDDKLNPVDTDGDNIPDYLDTDADNDQVPDWNESGTGIPPSGNDADNDGIDDSFDTDNGGPGLNESPMDTDDDGVPDYQDIDDDGDGIPTAMEDINADANPTNDDADGNGIPNYLDADDDGDGVPSLVEDVNQDGDPQDDTDGDGTPNYLDNDDDDDGILTENEDIDQNNDPTDDDTDGNGIPNYLDNDDDGDGIATEDEDVDQNGDPTGDDTDGDDLPNYLDMDDDNDGIDTLEEDFDQDGDLTNDDCDEDGIEDYLDADRCNLGLSKGFSPDNDGNNDYWHINGIQNHPDNEVRVFNRWGNEVFFMRSYNNEEKVWRGETNGRYVVGRKEVPDGTYFYVIDLGDGSKPLSGYVIIKR